MVLCVNAMSDSCIDALIKEDKCPFEPEWLKEVPMGQFHCPVCQKMILAGMPHPRYGIID